MEVTDINAIARSCTRWLSGHRRNELAPRHELEAIAAGLTPDAAADRYGRGELIADFEAQVARLLGKEQAVFMPSGTMAQQIALRIWADRRGSRNVAFHPTSHLELHEQKGYERLHGLHGILVGAPHALMTVDDLRAVPGPVAALLIELPQREIGGILPGWDDLVALVALARERGMALHLDGARLWECTPYYRRSCAEIAGLFDSVYVSFYKILGGIAGAALAGHADVIAEARIWQRRHGGNLVQLYPYVLSAKRGLDGRIDRMASYHEAAARISAAIREVPGVTLVPDPPHTNMAHVYLAGDRERIERAAIDLARETGLWLFHPLTPGRVPGQSYFEFVAGDATCDLDAAEVAASFEDLMRRAARD